MQPQRPPRDVTWLTATEAAEHATAVRRHHAARAGVQEPPAVTERTIRSWVARRHLTPATPEPDGLQRFTLDAVNSAERRTRARALRLLGVPTAQAAPAA